MVDKFEQLYLLKQPQVLEAFLEAISNITDRAVISDMTKAIEENDYDLLYRASGLTESSFNNVLDKIEEVYKESADIMVDKLPKKVETNQGVFYTTFNIRNRVIEEQLRERSSQFVKEITDEVRENIREVVTEGVALGNNPRETALNIVGRYDRVSKRRIGGVIGLTNSQVKWVGNVKKYLETLDDKYFNMTLRDKRFDSVVKKAIKEQKPLPKETIERLVIAYERKALKFRGDNIARTETISAINRAENAVIEQNLEEGNINREKVYKWWDDTGDMRTRLTHIQMGKKYNRKNPIPYDEPFVFPSGEKCMFPTDVSLGLSAKEVVNCRCKVQYDIKFAG